MDEAEATRLEVMQVVHIGILRGAGRERAIEPDLGAARPAVLDGACIGFECVVEACKAMFVGVMMHLSRSAGSCAHLGTGRVWGR